MDNLITARRMTPYPQGLSGVLTSPARRVVRGLAGVDPALRADTSVLLRQVAMRVAREVGQVEYRKADPGPIEEVVFFTHPSTRQRIYNAMRWREQMLAAPEKP